MSGTRELGIGEWEFYRLAVID